MEREEVNLPLKAKQEDQQRLLSKHTCCLDVYEKVHILESTAYFKWIAQPKSSHFHVVPNLYDFFSSVEQDVELSLFVHTMGVNGNQNGLPCLKMVEKMDKVREMLITNFYFIQY